MKDDYSVEEKLNELKNMNKSYLGEIKNILVDESVRNVGAIISYFTYSFNMSHNSLGENIIIGTYHVHNLSAYKLERPYICIKLSNPDLFQFSGKYKVESQAQVSGGWMRFNKESDKGEYWLQPVDRQILEANESLTFEKFQVKWHPTTDYSGSIMGYTYGRGYQKGIESLNHIHISGMMGEDG